MTTLIGHCIKLAEHCIAQWVSARPRLMLIPVRKDDTTRKQNAFVSSARRHYRR